MGGATDQSWGGEVDGLVGRDGVLASVHELVAAGQRTAVVVGLPGAGKTAVIAQVGRAATADGRTVLAMTGHATETDIPFAALVDLMGVAAEGEQMSLEDPLRLRLDVLAQLEEKAEDGPLLILLDDVQWFDRSSLSVLGFVANRLAGSGISLVATVRQGELPAALIGHPFVEFAAAHRARVDRGPAACGDRLGCGDAPAGGRAGHRHPARAAGVGSCRGGRHLDGPVQRGSGVRETAGRPARRDAARLAPRRGRHR